MDITLILSELMHLLSLTLLLYKCFRTKSATGVSGKTQILYALVLCTRNNDLDSAFISDDTGPMKICFIILTTYILYLIYFQFKDTREKDNDSFKIEYLVIPCALLASLLSHHVIISEMLYVMSFLLEEVALVPQMVLIYKTGKMEKYILPYFVLLGSYRGVYVLGLMYNGYNYYRKYYFPNPYCSVVQALICLYFFGYYFFFVKSVTVPGHNYTANLPEFINSDKLLGKPYSDLPRVFVIGSKQKREASLDTTKADA